MPQKGKRVRENAVIMEYSQRGSHIYVTEVLWRRPKQMIKEI